MAITLRTKLERKNNGIKVENAISFFKNLEKSKVSSGFHKDVGKEILKRATNTEFGGVIYFAPHQHDVLAPPRPIVRMYLYPEMKKDINKTYVDSIDYETNKKLRNPQTNAIEVLEKVGEMCKDLQKAKVFIKGFDTSTNTTGYDPNYNGAEIVEYKGFDQPWIGKTGETFEAIDYKVTKR